MHLDAEAGLAPVPPLRIVAVGRNVSHEKSQLWSIASRRIFLEIVAVGGMSGGDRRG